MGLQGLLETGPIGTWSLLPEVVSGSCFGGASILRRPLAWSPGLPPRPPAPTQGKGPGAVFRGTTLHITAS